MFSTTRNRRNLANSQASGGDTAELEELISTNTDDISDLDTRVTSIENGNIQATLVPDTDDSYDIGTSTKLFKQIYYRATYHTYNTTGTSCANGTSSSTTINWQTLVSSYDPDTLITRDSTTSTAFTLNQAGIYDVSVAIQFNSASTVGFRTLWSGLNSDVLGQYYVSSPLGFDRMFFSATFRATAGQKLRLNVIQTSGGVLTLQTGNDDTYLLITFRGFL